MDTTKNIISFCSGYGGIDRGLELAGVKVRVVAYVEIEAFAITNLVAKMETGLLVPAPVWTNLKTFPMEAFRGRIHGITAGYPCQPFSVAGQRKGTDDPRHLWPFIRRIYQTIQPGWMFFENVEGHVTLGLSTVISDMEEDGYTVKAGLFTAAEVGAPHRRKRVFILANRNGVNGRTLAEERYENQEVRSTGKVLGDSERQRLATRHTELPEHTVSIKTPNQPGMANTNQPRSQGRDSGELQECSVKWPARPGSPQHDWEAPRVVEPQVGGKPYGTYSRVDELRLLGNGVVPQQAARAWQILNGV